MTAYIINLDEAPERWAFAEKSFAALKMPRRRVPGIDGFALQLPVKEYAENKYRWFHGRNTRVGEIGCYLSHLEACKVFLATDEQHALICEDDVVFGPDFEAVLAEAVRYAAGWNVLRLTGLSDGPKLAGPKLIGDYSLCVRFDRLKGAGAYVVDRAAAQAFVTRMLPMWLPYDHAFDREWVYGLRAACIQPFPASQGEAGFRSSVQRGKRKPLSFHSVRRYFGTYPYQAFNELSRWVCRARNYLRLRRTSATTL